VIECSFAPVYAEGRPSFAEVCVQLAQAGIYPLIFLDFGRMTSPYAIERDVIFAKAAMCNRILQW
jgi:hypothetical protein